MSFKFLILNKKMQLVRSGISIGANVEDKECLILNFVAAKHSFAFILMFEKNIIFLK